MQNLFNQSYEGIDTHTHRHTHANQEYVWFKFPYLLKLKNQVYGYRIRKNFRGWFNFIIFVVSLHPQKFSLSEVSPTKIFPTNFCLDSELVTKLTVRYQTFIPTYLPAYYDDNNDQIRSYVVNSKDHVYLLDKVQGLRRCQCHL